MDDVCLEELEMFARLAHLGGASEEEAFHVAATPEAVLALIERIRHLEQTLEAEREWHGCEEFDG